MKKLRIFVLCFLLCCLSVTGTAAEEIRWSWNKTDTGAFTVSGSMTVDGGTMHNDWSNGKSRAILNEYLFGDRVEMNLNLRNGGVNAGSEVWAVLNYQDDNNYYYAAFGGGADTCPAIWKKENGQYQKLAQAEQPFDLFNNPKDIKVQNLSGEISVVFENTVLVQASDSAFQTGKVGLETWDSVLYMKSMEVSGNAGTSNKWVWDGTEQGWNLKNNMKVKGATISNDWDNKTANAVYSAAKWSEYTFEITVQNEGSGNDNRIDVLFHYQNDGNYYGVSVGGCYIPEGQSSPSENTVSLFRVTDGKQEELATYAGTFPVTFNPGILRIQSMDGRFQISGYDGNGKYALLFDGVENLFGPSGMIGVAARASVGYFKNISVAGEMEDIRFFAACENIQEGEIGVSTDISPLISFNMPVDRGSVHKSAIRILENGVPMSDTRYGYTVTPEGNLQITFVKALKQKTEYTFELGTQICSQEYGTGLYEPLILHFTTRAPEVDIYFASAIDASGSPVAVGEVKNGEITVKTGLRYTGAETEKPYVLCLLLTDEAGTVYQTALTSGDFGKMPETVAEHRLNIPKENCRVEVYLWDSLSQMTTLYPHVIIN